ncbi:hypothetical protein K443DRAFT_671849 [Laccaria amethystina LaAM-08-1]|uniref:Uncharacterized protein n=1 Tax=Laccaria amethystina LaAM-08-1 TaxID=1095629 RepID=A0A0C9Y5U8_9AGAR|nr:hypothetical protein K443DRAFT_671849 [Laccaria amethystina LaAM-08-1]
MAPKGQRAAGTSQLRTHSRSSSATKLGGNIQLTQKDVQPQGRSDKLPKKNGFEPHAKAAPPFARVNSSQRIVSRDHLHPPSTSRRPNLPKHGKPKAGFTIASSGDGDDDEWVSSESGVATPALEDSDTDTVSEADTPQHDIVHTQSPEQLNTSAQLQAPLPRVDTARPSHFESTIYPHPDPNHHHDHPSQPEESLQRQHQHEPEDMDTVDASFQPRTGSQPHSKRSSRPPSTRSISSRPEHHLRPHPLIRGQSYGHAGIIKPAPLAPLTVRPGPQPTSSAPQSLNDGSRNHLSTSPTSILTTSSSAEAPYPSHDRRTSFSSTRSVTTAPSIVREPAKAHDRSRTASTMSASSSSAALSALAHLPSVTRPPSPQTIAFFPPVNPHLNIEGIHPLLPVPYLNNHLTVLMRRTPIRESFDRVIRAKQAL